MNEKENEKLEQILRKTHIPEPTPILKECITSEAKKVWNQNSQEIPWQIPARRLAASAVAAVIIMSITNFYNNKALKRWHFKDDVITSKQISELETLPDIPYRPFVKHLISVGRKPSIIDASALRNYTERVRRILNETQQSGASNGRVPNGGRSFLFPVQSGSDYYS